MLFGTPSVKAIPSPAPGTNKKQIKFVLLFLTLIICSSIFSQNPESNSALEIMPVSFITFNAKLLDKKVILNWTSITERIFSHYIVERSFNGSKFYEVGMIIANGNTDHKTEYEFTDKINIKGNGMFYYRLRMIDLDGKHKHTPTRLIRIAENVQTASISVYPNPATNQLRITIPESWQNKKVSFDVYKSNGTIVRHVVNERAGQTEVIPIQDITAGLYIVKAATGDNSFVHQVIKAK